MDRLTIGGKLKKLRKAEGMTQQVLADEFNIKQDDISRYENDKQELNLSILSLYCKRFKVSADYLLGLTENPTVDKDVRAICDYTGLSEKAVEKLRRNNAFSMTEVERQTLEIGGDIEKGELNKGDILNAFIEGKYYTNIISYVQDYFVGFKKNKKAIDEFIPEMEKRLGQLKDGSMTTWFDTDIDKLNEIDNGYKSNRYYRFEMQEIVTSFADEFCKAKKEDYDKAKKRYDDLKGEIEKRVSAHIQSIQKKRKGGTHGNNQETQ